MSSLLDVIGTYTGVIGSIREQLGLVREVVSPFSVVSEEYNLGMWRPDDLE